MGKLQAISFSTPFAYLLVCLFVSLVNLTVYMSVCFWNKSKQTYWQTDTQVKQTNRQTNKQVSKQKECWRRSWASCRHSMTSWLGRKGRRRWDMKQKQTDIRDRQIHKWKKPHTNKQVTKQNECWRRCWASCRHSMTSWLGRRGRRRWDMKQKQTDI